MPIAKPSHINLNKPKFDTWERADLEKFAEDIERKVEQLVEQNEQLRINFKDAMSELRKHKDDWK